MRRAVLNILITLQLSLTLSVTEAYNICLLEYEYKRNKFKGCICADTDGSYSPWCYGTDRNTKLICGLLERDLQKLAIPNCAYETWRANACPYEGYFFDTFRTKTKRCYGLQRIRRGWREAQTACESEPGANLARLTRNVSDHIAGYFIKHWWPHFEENTWIGLNDPRKDGVFKWVGKYPQVGWTNWASGQPTIGGRHCVEILPKDNLKWNNALCTESRASLCETARLCTHLSSSCLAGSDCVAVSTTAQLCCVNSEMDYCFDRNNNCKTNPCNNGGVCVSMLGPGSRRCTCVNGFTGSVCEEDIDECLSRPCSEGASGCINGKNEFQCTCRAGYTGVTCQTEIVSTTTPSTTTPSTTTPSTTTPSKTTPSKTTHSKTTRSITKTNTTVDSIKGASPQNTAGSPGSDQGTAQGALNENLPESSGANRLLKMNTDCLYELSVLVNVIFCLYCLYLIL